MSRQPLQYRTYASWRQPASARKQKRPFTKAAVVLVAVMILGGASVYGLSHKNNPSTPATAPQSTSTASKSNSTGTASAAKQPAPTNYCANNTLPQLALVSVSRRHIWACDGNKQVYDSPVVTGMENLAADLTPVGTYHIYGKQIDLYLNGSDSTGSWHDYVHYWMPWLSNQYGVYGFHDATWRSNSAFGNISPYSSNASHGCVELPLATAKWLYNWAQIGTTVTIEA